MNNINASIITIGDELLIGQVIDTNSAYMAKVLNGIGVKVRHRIAVGDVWEDIWNALDAEEKKADIILITGGLGPTSDDITKPLLCEYFGGSLVKNDIVLQHIEQIFYQKLKVKGAMLERNIQQAYVPNVCEVLHNEHGTAPGMLFEKNGKIFVSMPGVPHEMRGLMHRYVVPLIQQRFQLPFIVHQTLTTIGVGESYLAEMLATFEQELPDFIRLAYLPNLRSVRLRLSALGHHKEVLEQTVNQQFEKIQHILGDKVAFVGDKSLQEVIAEKLLESQSTLATAESCTGGSMAALFTELEGASQYFKGSIVAYNNDVKVNSLHIDNCLLEKYGAVSEEVVRQMAQNLRTQFSVDYAIATSGILGPNEVDRVPAGRVWVAVATKHSVVTEMFDFPFSRERNREATIKFGLFLLLQQINKCI